MTSNLDNYYKYNATQRAKSKLERILNVAERILTDSNHDDRVADNCCKACFYLPKVHGQAFTYGNCGICKVEMAWPSTGIPLICTSCATQRNVCKFCFSDMNDI